MTTNSTEHEVLYVSTNGTAPLIPFVLSISFGYGFLAYRHSQRAWCSGNRGAGVLMAYFGLNMIFFRRSDYASDGIKHQHLLNSEQVQAATS